jgi:hypothetical protein
MRFGDASRAYIPGSEEKGNPQGLITNQPQLFVRIQLNAYLHLTTPDTTSLLLGDSRRDII